MKKVLSILLTVLMVCSVLCVGASAATVYTSGSYEYTVSGSNATITKYNGSASDVTIPSTLGGKTVVCIDNLAFGNCDNLTSVSIPSTVTTITTAGSTMHGAFYNCSKLRTVTIAEGKKDAVIGNASFRGCSSLSSITIPKNYVSIGEYAFSGCTQLKSLTLKESYYGYPVQTIQSSAFDSCTSLESISLPVTLKSIESNAFCECDSLTTLNIPEGVELINNLAFGYCDNLTSVSIPSTVTTITTAGSTVHGAFYNCSKLRTVTIAEGEKDAIIGNASFRGCSSLMTIHIPSNYKRIGEMALAGCPNLTICNETYNCYAKTYADQNGIPFKICSNNHNETKKFTLTFNANGGSVSLSSVTVGEGISVILPTPTKSGYTCLGWSKNSSATSASYACGASYTPTANTTFYAVWKKNPEIFTVNFNANGGTVSPTSVTVSEDIAVIVPTPTRSGYTCLGWATSSSASRATVDCGAGLKPSSDITLYAVWKKVSEPIVMNVELNYKSTVKAAINGFNAEKYSTDNSSIATVSSDGTITGTGRGSTTVHAYDKSGNEAKINVTVNYTWWQWIIKIVLFGWIWY